MSQTPNNDEKHFENKVLEFNNTYNALHKGNQCEIDISKYISKENYGVVPDELISILKIWCAPLTNSYLNYSKCSRALIDTDLLGCECLIKQFKCLSNLASLIECIHDLSISDNNMLLNKLNNSAIPGSKIDTFLLKANYLSFYWNIFKKELNYSISTVLKQRNHKVTPKHPYMDDYIQGILPLAYTNFDGDKDSAVLRKALGISIADIALNNNFKGFSLIKLFCIIQEKGTSIENYLQSNASEVYKSSPQVITNFSYIFNYLNSISPFIECLPIKEGANLGKYIFSFGSICPITKEILQLMFKNDV